MYGWAITCSDTSSSLGVSHANFCAGWAVSLLRSSPDFAASIVSFNSLIFPPLVHTSDGQQLPTVGLRVTQWVCDRTPYCRQHCITPPRVPVGFPRLQQALAAQVCTDLGKGSCNLDPAVGQHEQGCRRRLEAA